ncbi:peptidase inhibitor family I36 protein [Streptomyces sp. JJ36]|uniref:peptidase inhibitor family I36 protein n=1 Tax=Streptomyces sp. JJ36 TaxID=2736645 RepID=UPI0027E3F202|nr:peptidase inhibitor family I36 protein [Streptomyces sp. JJ36]
MAAPSGAAAQPVAPAAGDGPRLGACGAGVLCFWADPGFSGRRLTYELAGTDIESCVRLPAGFTADAYANRTGRPVTAYQSAECRETGEFHTHPSGSWTPESAYQVRAFKIWER